jgi:hypothetical protein
VIARELDYRNPDEVQEGAGAQVAYPYAAFDQEASAGSMAEFDASLRTYCRQDIWGMVEVAYFPARAGRPGCI